MVENKTYRIDASFSVNSVDIDGDYKELMDIFNDYPVMQKREGGELTPMQGDDYCYRTNGWLLLELKKQIRTISVDIKQATTLDDVVEFIERIKKSSTFRQD